MPTHTGLIHQSGMIQFAILLICQQAYIRRPNRTLLGSDMASFRATCFDSAESSYRNYKVLCQSVRVDDRLRTESILLRATNSSEGVLNQRLTFWIRPGDYRGWILDVRLLAHAFSNRKTIAMCQVARSGLMM